MCEICFVTGVLLKIDSEALETKRSDLPQKCHLHCALTGDWMKKLLNAAAIVTKSVQARQYLAEKYEKSLDNTTSRVATQAKSRFQVLHGQTSAGSAWNLRCCFGSLFDEGLHEKICIQASFWTKNHTDTCARPTLFTMVGFANGTRCQWTPYPLVCGRCLFKLGSVASAWTSLPKGLSNIWWR